MTSAENKLWAELRGRQLEEQKFVRQEPIGPYVADFVCRNAKLIVEVDGATHGSLEEIAHDEKRTRYLEGRGYKVVRFQNDDIYHAMEGVLSTIKRHLAPR
ncbi:hypothetical protein BH10PSE7_BH10PSE7_03620 [soil metagenome]